MTTEMMQFMVYHETATPCAPSTDQERSAAFAVIADSVRRQGKVAVAQTLRRVTCEPFRVIPAEDIARRASVDEATGHVGHWEVEAGPLPPLDANTVVLTGTTVEVPDVLAGGGEVRIRHNLSTPVVVYAYAGDEQVPYLLASEIDDDVVHVEFYPGVTHFEVHPEVPS